MRKKKNSPVKDLLLTRYAPIADGIATLFFPYAEVVIHDLHDQTVLYLANNLSKREVGDDSALEEIDHSARERVIGPYEKLNWDGRRMRCVSNVLFDDRGEPAGVMCINFNIAVFEDARRSICSSRARASSRSRTNCSATTGRIASTPSCTRGCANGRLVSMR
jgi:predicted transcriptional regulator YheO